MIAGTRVAYHDSMAAKSIATVSMRKVNAGEERDRDVLVAANDAGSRAEEGIRWISVTVGHGLEEALKNRS